MWPHGFHEFRQTPLLNNPSGGFALTWLKRIFKPKFKGIHSNFVGQHIHGAFKCEIDLGRSSTTRCAAPGIVGIDHSGPGVDVGNIIRAGEHEQGPVHHHMANGVVCAFVHQIIIAVSRQVPLGVCSQLNVHFECVALGTHQHAFGKTGNISNRPLEMKRRCAGNPLGDHVNFNSELATGIRLPITHVFPAERSLKHPKMKMNVDTAANDHQPCILAFFLLFPVSHCSFRFQRRLVIDLGIELRFDNSR